MKKKIISILLVAGLTFSLIGCGTENNTTNNTNTTTQAQSNDEKQPENSNEQQESQDEKKNEIADIKLNEEFNVKTDSGTYSVTVEGIRFTDERNEYSEIGDCKVFFLDFAYKNIDSTEEIYVFDSHFKIMDEEGNVLKTYPISDDTRMSQRLPAGGKCESSAAYALETESKTLKILFYDNMFGNPIGQMTIETGL